MLWLVKAPDSVRELVVSPLKLSSLSCLAAGWRVGTRFCTSLKVEFGLQNYYSWLSILWLCVWQSRYFTNEFLMLLLHFSWELCCRVRSCNGTTKGMSHASLVFSCSFSFTLWTSGRWPNVMNMPGLTGWRTSGIIRFRTSGITIFLCSITVDPQTVRSSLDVVDTLEAALLSFWKQLKLA